MKSLFRILCPLVAIAMIQFLSACEDSGGDSGDSGGSSDIGDNDANLVVALGDSMFVGKPGGGAPVPSRVGAMTAKTVDNVSDTSTTSGDGAARIGGQLAKKPAYIIIMYGIIDIEHGVPASQVGANLRAMANAAKDNHTIPILTTLPHVYDSHAQYQGLIDQLNPEIRSAASATGAKLADLAKDMGDDKSMILPDGLHFSDAGSQEAAAVYAEKIK